MYSTTAASLDRPDDVHIDHVRRRQQDSLSWLEVDRPPLGIWVNNPQHRSDLLFEDIFDFRAFFQLQTRILADTLAAGSDITPALAINSFGDGILPSMFGADLIVPPVNNVVIQDLGPWVVPLLSSRSAIAAVRKPPLDRGLFPKACDAVRYYRDHAPDWLPVVTPMRLGPLSIAMLLCGQAFYTNLYDHPQEMRHLLQVCTDLFLETETRLFSIAGMSRCDTVTNFGVSLRSALRLGDDVVINLNEDMIEEFAVPFYRQIAQVFGGKVLVHFCSMPSARGHHVMATLARHPDTILGVSTQLGAEYYVQHQEELAGVIGVEAGYGIGISSYRESCGSFLNWATSLAQFRRRATGLVLYTEVPTIEQAQSMWDDWLAVHHAGRSP